MANFIAELKRRNVIRVAIAYLAMSWLLLQAGGLLVGIFDVPQSAMRVMFLLLLIGFIPALIFSWVYELTPEGLKRDGEVNPAESIAPLTGRRLDRLIIGVLTVVVALLLADKFLLRGKPEEKIATAVVAAPAERAVAETPNAPPATSIAVLPFADLSQTKDQEYFSDGLAEELLDLLAKVPQLHVAGRTSAFSFKGKNENLKTIGAALGVATILEGSVRKSGDRLRITTQLIKVSDGYHLWSETYDRKLTDVFAVQDEIAQAVVAALKVKLLPDQKTPESRRRTDNIAAYNEYLLGRQFMARTTREDTVRARDAFQRAVTLDPNYAAAYSGLAIAEFFVADASNTTAVLMEGRQRALAAADRAIALDPGLADGYSARGYINSASVLKWSEALAETEHAVALDPGDSLTQGRYASALGALGRHADAIAAAQKSVDLDPLSGQAWFGLGFALVGANKLPEAHTALTRAIEISPQNIYAHCFLGLVALVQGDYKAARAEYALGGPTFSEMGVAMTEHSLGHAKESQQALDTMTAQYAESGAYQIATVYAWRGEKNQAFAWLERARVQQDGGLTLLKGDPLLRGLQTDPRYAAFLKKLGLPA